MSSLYDQDFHGTDLKKLSFLVTGGAGFIGSNLVEYLVHHGAGKIRILDNLCEGSLGNIANFLDRKEVEFIEADIVDESVCRSACEGIDFISHQAALGSVPRSFKTPLKTNQTNVTGFLNMLNAAKEAGVKRFVYASSSSVYGDSPDLPKVESKIGRPLSPYAVSKYTNELYAKVFSDQFEMVTVGLRYFNVFGPRQKPDGPYAAVIPLFIDSVINSQSPRINGDGEQSRDFTFVSNAVQANIRGMFAPAGQISGQAFNIAFGERRTVNQLFSIVRTLAHSSISAIYREDRPGDVRHSLADISKASALLQYNPKVDIDEGLRLTFEWFRKKHASV